MNFKKGNLTALILASSLLSLPVYATPDNLTISNSTRHILSFRVNGLCSKTIGNLHRSQTMTVPGYVFKGLCRNNLANCQLKAYDAPACLGKPISSLAFDLLKHGFAFNGDVYHNSITTTVSGVSGNYQLTYSEAIRK